MHDPRHIASVAVGTATAATGGLSLAQLQTTLGIVATSVGLLLTIATFIWRWKEHRHKMRERPKNFRESEETQ